MKKNLVVGLMAIGLIAAGGTGLYFEKAKENSQGPIYYMQQGMGGAQMTNVTKTGTKWQTANQNSGFEQMLPYMRKMHPGLSDAQLKSLYESMHGPNGACMGNYQGGTENKTENTSNHL